MKDNKKKLFLSPKEFVWYIIASAMIMAGLVQIILGLIVEFANVKVSDFPLYQGNKDLIGWSKLSFLHWGLVWLAAGVVLGVIVLCIFATSVDREAEKANRRAARLGKIVTEARVEDVPQEEVTPSEEAAPVQENETSTSEAEIDKEATK